MGNVELFELGETPATVQCQSCFKHMTERMIFCECGCCLRPNEDIINKIEAIFKTLIALTFSSSKKFKREKNMESNNGKKIIGKQRVPREVPRSMVIPQFWTDDTAMRYTNIPKWQEDAMNLIAKFSTISTYTIDNSYSSPYHHWSRYENTITMKSGDPEACLAAKREDFKKTTKMLYSLRKEQGKVNSSIRQEKRTGQRDELDPTLQERLEWLSRHRREAFSTISTSSTPAWTRNWWSDDKWQEECWKEYQRWRSEGTVFIMHLEKDEYIVKYWRRHQG